MAGVLDGRQMFESDQAILNETSSHVAGLSLLLEMPSIFVARFDNEGRICFFNSSFQRYLRVEFVDIIGKSLCEIIPGVTSEVLHGMILKTVTTERVVEFEHDYDITTDVGSRVCRANFIAIRERDRTIGVFMVARDVTEEKQMLNLLYAKDKTHQTLMEHLPVSIARFGLDGRIVYTNHKMSTWLCDGGSGALLQVGLLETLHEKVLATIKAGESNEMDFQWVTYDGNDHYGVIQIISEYDQDGQVCGALAIGHDVTEVMKIRTQVFFDQLTGLPSRALFNDRLRQLLMDATRYERTLALLLLDMDDFNVVNGVFGQAGGDQLLCLIAERLHGVLRSSDTLARLDGDEFAVILPQISGDYDVRTVVGNIASCMAVPFVIDGREVYLSVCIGAAKGPVDAHNAETLFECAEAALYSARSIGRDNFQFYTGEMTAIVEERIVLESSLHQALQHKEMELYYQPKLSLDNQVVVGAEALLRWHHPLYGTLAPDKFISIAETTGLIVKIGEWVLVEACRRAVLWNRSTKNNYKIAVNVSPRQFAEDGFAELVRQTLLETGCRPEWIELEITENMLLDERVHISNTLKFLANYGISIAVDDFGTGYSSLIYLIRYPVATLKIDRSFINEITNLPGNADLVSAIIVMAKSLHLQVVAEGVETEEQAKLLAEAGCDMGQGYLWSKPVPADIFTLKFCSDELNDGT